MFKIASLFLAQKSQPRLRRPCEGCWGETGGGQVYDMMMKIIEDKTEDDRYRDGAYRVTVWAALEDATLQLENLFECEMFLPQTDFRLSKSTIYSPSKSCVSGPAGQLCDLI